MAVKKIIDENLDLVHGQGVESVRERILEERNPLEPDSIGFFADVGDAVDAVVAGAGAAEAAGVAAVFVEGFDVGWAFLFGDLFVDFGEFGGHFVVSFS